MKPSTPWIYIWLSPVSGLAIGLLMSSIMTNSGMREEFIKSETLSHIYEVIHFPVWGLMSLWIWLGLPPRGDAGFLLYPCAVVVQWFLIGFIISVIIWLKFRMTDRPAATVTTSRTQTGE